MTNGAPSDKAKMVRMGLLIGLVPLTMVGMGFAAVPLYDLFCRVTGFGGTTRVASAAPTEVLDRTMKVRFHANIAPGLGLEFHPDQQAIDVKLGETAMAFYSVTNTTDEPIAAVATYNVAPFAGGPYFQKLECFCFLEQTFEPGQTVRLPVIFFVDPQLADPETAHDARSLQTVTLSYTYFPAREARARYGTLPKAPARPAEPASSDQTARAGRLPAGAVTG
jgi:cytochrome c oxidase assembly protein subunit 11